MASQAVSKQEILDLPTSKSGVSFEEFWAWCDEDTFAEFVDGEVIVFSPASKQHRRIGSFEALFYQLRDGCYKNVKVDAAGIYHSDVIQGFRLKESWLWEIPPLLEVLQELNLLS